ncbi:hypothetical protein ACFVHB_15630 [Kitasatospora sp. NPDC127111]|uniref:hypothetical protein n=1 Tax=Kitasatospora sp. NPDC127111 TaxID=3345363 RepID=UPI0036260D90
MGCTVTDDPYHLSYHSGHFVGVADLKVMNHTTKVSDYFISVEFVDSQGNRLDMAGSIVSKLAPGQSQNNGDEDTKGLKPIGEGAHITCRILSVERNVSTE